MNMVACSVAVDLASSKRAFDLFIEYRDVVKNFVGIHPEAAAKEDLDAFAEMFSHNIKYIDGVGEIGLDKTYDERGISSYDAQKKVFGAMLGLAETSGKPVSIHSRKALDDVLQILTSYRLKGVLLHWFAGSKKQLAQAVDTGYFVSFGPALVYSDDKKVLLRNAPKDRILAETDGPVAYSHCFANLSAASTSFLVSVAYAMARVLGMNYEEAAILLEKNAKSYLST
jgi:TatD DNase family protein